MNELFYPTIDLFIYDLRNPLNADVEEIDSNVQAFRSRLPQGIELQDVETEAEFRELIAPARVKLNPVNLALEGYYYPVLLNDTYGLQIDCSVDNLTEPQPIDAFGSIAQEIAIASCSSAVTIGRTWLLSGWLTYPGQETTTLALDCYGAVFKEAVPEIGGRGVFLNADIFEVRQSQFYDPDRVLVVIFPDQATAQKAANFYPDWMGLFCYQHKISWAYRQSRVVKEALANHYKKVERNAEIIEESQGSKVNLAHLQRIFNDVRNILNQYTIDLLKLSFQRQIIDINLVNYRTRLQRILQKNGEAGDLGFLSQFGELAAGKYLAQIDKDVENMQLGLKLLETNINALRSQIELEKSERDLDFQNLVKFVGAGTAVTALIDYNKGEKCKAISQIFPKSAPYKHCDNFLVGGVLVPIGFLLTIAMFVLILKSLYGMIKKYSEKRSPEQ